MAEKKDNANEEELWKFNRIVLTITLLVSVLMNIKLALFIARNDRTTCLQDVQHGGQILTATLAPHDKRELAQVNFMSSEVDEYLDDMDDGNELIEYVNVERRNKWIWTSLVVGGIILAAAATLTAAWAPALVAGGLGRIIYSLVVGASAIMAVAGSIGSTVTNGKRDSYNNDWQHGQFMMVDATNTKYYFYDVLQLHGNSIHELLTRSTINQYMAFTTNGTGSDNAGGLLGYSDNGTHFILTEQHYSITELINDIVDQHNADCIGDCYVNNLNNIHLMKKTNYYQVNWASYNYDIWSEEYQSETRYPGLNGQQVIDGINQGYLRNGNPDTWKYCMCIDGDTSGQYNDIPIRMGMTGEVYFNTYGGIDGYCNNAHCGAQCQSDGCT
ncbi:MAG: DUF5341 domain-containing protein [Corynebacterium sp.]|nr:DUF5341 domain-containing protein [Corynebacterium sp.]